MVSKEGNALPRLKRRTRNQQVFREVNARIAEVSAEFDVAPNEHEFICECANIGCSQTVRVPLAVFQRTREDPTMFVVTRGHEDLPHETIVEAGDDYVIVRTRPEHVPEPAAST